MISARKKKREKVAKRREASESCIHLIYEHKQTKPNRTQPLEHGLIQKYRWQNKNFI